MTSPQQNSPQALTPADGTVIANHAPKILLVKISSLGDVLHNLPIVWDLRKRIPNAQIDWIVEEAYVHLLEPLKSTEGFKGIDRIIPIALRRWRKNLWRLQTWQEFLAMRQVLQATTYDVILETQGLIKSAVICALTKKSDTAIVAGLANATEYSGYEPLARMFYTQAVQVPLQCHAIDRSRYVMCAAFDWPLLSRQDEPPLFYPSQWIGELPVLAMKDLQKSQDGSVLPYILCFHSSARAAKRWPSESWVDLGRALSSQGYQLVFPWGTPAEKALSDWMASQIPGAIVPRAISIEEAYPLIAHAALTIGVDTGLTHLAAVLGKPTVEIYCDSPRWKTEGYWSNQIANHGDLQNPPTVTEVLDACKRLLATT
ncbi:RfaF ADP-heptose,LPS heptosyltransferase [Burkholderiaceae bacterium]